MENTGRHEVCELSYTSLHYFLWRLIMTEKGEDVVTEDICVGF